MDEQKFRDLLEQLHGELEKTQSVDEKGRELLRDLDTHIRELLERSEVKPIQAQPNMAKQVEETIKHFEITHPTLTMALSELLTALNNAGI